MTNQDAFQEYQRLTREHQRDTQTLPGLLKWIRESAQTNDKSSNVRHFCGAFSNSGEYVGFKVK